MSYEKTTWSSGDTITAEKLNNIEDGIAGADNRGVFAVGFQEDGGTLDKTWKEIHDAVSDGKLSFVFFMGEDEIGIGIVMSVYEEGGYSIDVMGWNEGFTYTAETENGYPTSASDDNDDSGDNGGGDAPT